MTRVTESITVPVSSEARLPQALMAAGFMNAAAREITVEPVSLPEQHSPAAASETDGWSVADAALIKKYASQPGE